MEPETKKYKVLAEVTIGEATHAEGAEVELTEEAAAPFVTEGKLELVAEAA